MSGYVPVFGSIYQGTLCGKWPDAAVWATILPLADRHGRIDYTPEAIAALTGWPLDLLRQGLTGLCAPDPHSRSDANEGRRLVLIDPSRSWGWQVVNHGKYREKARKSSFDAARIADGRNAERMRDRRLDPTRPAMTRDDPPSNSNPNINKDTRGARGRALPPEFDLTPDREAYARGQGVSNPRQTFDTFRDHFTATGKAMKDWDAAWRNWCRREKTFTRSAPNRADPKPVVSRPLSDADRARVEATQRALAERAAALSAPVPDDAKAKAASFIADLAAKKAMPR